MDSDLQLLGVPQQYRRLNPYTLDIQHFLDAYPNLARPDSVNIWMDLHTKIGPGDRLRLPHVAWQRLLVAYIQRCESIGRQPFVLPSDRRNHDEHVRSFLAPRRRRVRDYIDGLGLLENPVFKAEREYVLNSNSWSLTSAVKFYKMNDGLDIGHALALDQRWNKTFYPKYRATVTWHKWIQYGICRVGWSASAINNWLWYEIRCPELPGISGAYRHIDKEQFDSHVDDLWIPIVRNIRMWSSNSPRLRKF